MNVFLLLFLQVQYSGGSCSDTNTGYFIGFSAVFFFVCAISVAQLVIIISVQNNKKSKVMKYCQLYYRSRENSQHFAMPPVVSPWKYVLEMGAEILY